MESPQTSALWCHPLLLQDAVPIPESRLYHYFRTYTGIGSSPTDPPGYAGQHELSECHVIPPIDRSVGTGTIEGVKTMAAADSEFLIITPMPRKEG